MSRPGTPAPEEATCNASWDLDVVALERALRHLLELEEMRNTKIQDEDEDDDMSCSDVTTTTTCSDSPRITCAASFGAGAAALGLVALVSLGWSRSSSKSL
eukprot:TRINITY_DN49309_c0_g1_i1.p3 TRINITY_DN49309_c0_g1~~TRINITY_DN49309_c0_g1_i1.p3  ORF type:complete len:101 (-),score=24.85 TRINITY_DN49309_c0_g1_i1:28-330(-)